MAITVKHSTAADGTFSATGATAWNADHTLAGLGTMAEQNANNVTITGGSITGVTGVGTVTSVTGTAPVVSSGGNTPDISMAKATTSVDGYLSATDWTTFNNKGSGSVTSVAATVPSFLSVTGSPITTSGTLALTYSGTALPVANGGTGQTTASAAFNALSPLTTAGDTLYGGTSGAGTRLAIGTAGQVLTVNSGATAPQWSTPTTGTVTSVSGTGTVSGISLSGTVTSSGSLTLGGTLDLSSPPTIGNTAPNTGKFTTLESTGTASLGTTSTTYVQAIGDASYPGVYATGGTNTPLILQPLGTGALQAQKTTSSATGGNARGANAVDWQTNRTAATQVASGSSSFIGGGVSNTSSGFDAVVCGGSGNTASANYTLAVGGLNNTSSGSNSGVVGGNANTANGYLNFIGGGYQNSGTTGSAVTTNTTTIAVTASTTLYLTSTNANIKVGQLITGTGITTFPFTYATSTVTTGTAAVMNTSTISGTTLTVGSLASGTIIAGQVLTGTGVTAGTYIVSGSGLSWTVSTSQTVASTTITGTAYTFTISQNATIAAGVTLSFYTPHGVVVGGGNNQATGSYSFIGGGGDAGTAVNRNAASGDYATVVGGIKNLSSGAGAFIGGGGVASTTFNGNTSSNQSSFVGAGVANNASAIYSAIAGGSNNQANSAGSFIGGGYYGTTRSISGMQAMSACNTPVAASAGINQAALLILARQTTDATATVLASDSNTPAGTNQVILPNNSAYYFKVRVIAGVTGAGDTKAWTLEGAIKRGAGVGTAAIVGTVTTTVVATDTGAATWAVTATADTTNGGLKITVTGQASTTIRWVAKAETVEMTY